MTEFGDAVASVGPHATSLQTDNHTNTSSLNFCRPDDLPDAEPTVSKQTACWLKNEQSYWHADHAFQQYFDHLTSGLIQV